MKSYRFRLQIESLPKVMDHPVVQEAFGFSPRLETPADMHSEFMLIILIQLVELREEVSDG